MMRGAVLGLAAAMLAAGSVACARSSAGDGSGETSGDASLLDATRDSSLGYVDATGPDSYATAGEGDAALEASPSPDAAEGPDANADASTAADAGPDAGPDAGANADASTSDAAARHLPCDTCTRGNQECGPLPQVCTYDAGVAVSCGVPGTGILTCVVGDAGCAVWAPAIACRSDVPCCVPCEHEYACPVGAIGDPCEQDTDCAFNACDAVTHACIASQCADHRQDGDETDVDCGGSLCNSCRTGQGCQANFDCVGGDYCAPSHLCE
jgi:hypothetical protein